MDDQNSRLDELLITIEGNDISKLISLLVHKDSYNAEEKQEALISAIEEKNYAALDILLEYVSNQKQNIVVLNKELVEFIVKSDFKVLNCFRKYTVPSQVDLCVNHPEAVEDLKLSAKYNLPDDDTLEEVLETADGTKITTLWNFAEEERTKTTRVSLNDVCAVSSVFNEFASIKNKNVLRAKYSFYKELGGRAPCPEDLQEPKAVNGQQEKAETPASVVKELKEEVPSKELNKKVTPGPGPGAG